MPFLVKTPSRLLDRSSATRNGVEVSTGAEQDWHRPPPRLTRNLGILQVLETDGTMLKT